MRHRLGRWCVLSILGVAVIYAADPYPRVSEEGYRARLGFFAHTPGVPHEGRVVRRWTRDSSIREKVVFRGAQGFLVPGYVEFLKTAAKPYPLVVLLHGWSGSKEAWYEDNSYYSGGILRKGLLEAGYAVLALDAAAHGERGAEIGYQDVNPFTDPGVPPRLNYFSFAEIAVQTVKDHRRALDYMASRGDIDMERIGLAGYSMGGMNAFYLLAVEPRIRMAVACVPPLSSPGYGPTSPIDYTWGLGGKPLLLLMGRRDDMNDPARVEASYRAYMEGPRTRLIWYDQGHKLGPAYVPDALAFIRLHLPTR